MAGWPVAHSRSPAMQNAALAQAGLGLSWRYQLLPLPPALFAEAVRALSGAGFRGINVTIPHKEAALALSDLASSRARAIGAANTLIFDGARITAENTDAPGLISSLPISPAGRSALVLGAGGTARAAVWALLDAGAAPVMVWNRNPERARQLAAELGATALPAGASAPRVDLLINCTPVGLQPGDETLPPMAAEALEHCQCVVDFVYRPSGTALGRAAQARGQPLVDGIDLLVAQGALAFKLFTGREASVAVMRAAARNMCSTDVRAGPADTSTNC